MAKTDKRKDILMAALELFAEQGFHGAPMAVIAEKAGVAAGTIYCYFKSRDILINELFREVEERTTAFLQDGYMVEHPINERFLHLGTRLLRYFITHPLDFRYLEQFLNSPYGIEFRRGKILGSSDEPDLIKTLFEQGTAQGVMKDIPIAVFFALSFGPLLHVARDHILGFVELDDALIQLTVDACWDSVKR